MFEVRRAGVKGLGVFATRLIPRGTRILSEAPALTITKAQPDILKAASEIKTEDITRVLGLSTNDTPRARWSSTLLSIIPTIRLLTSNLTSTLRLSGKENRRLLNVFYNNNFALHDALDTRAVFPSVARLNHSCIPSAQGNFNTNLGRFTVHALRDIPEDEEVTISYLHNEIGLRQERIGTLVKGYGFACGCPICAGNGNSRNDSEVRREQYRDLLESYRRAVDKEAVSGPGTSKQGSAAELFSIAHEMIDVYVVEGLAGREMASLYAITAGHALDMGDLESAETLGGRALQLEEDAVGRDSPFYAVAKAALQDLKFPKHSARQRDAVEEQNEDMSYAPWT